MRTAVLVVVWEAARVGTPFLDEAVRIDRVGVDRFADECLRSRVRSLIRC
jgi:hypothetical protein